MTRLSDALKRASETADAPTTVDETTPQAAATPWQFSPVETMHVPDEPVTAPGEVRRVKPVAHPASAPAFDAGEQLLMDTPALAPAAPPVAEPQPPAPVAGPRFGVDRDKLIIGDGVDSALVEQYRQLAAVMHHAQKASNVRSVMVTSALPSEGKTLTATNLALTLSESYQKRVLLIDADLRRPRMKEMFALAGAEGLTDSLSMRREGRLPVQHVTPNLWVLTSGAIVPDPMGLLVSPAMKQLLDDAQDSFDWVVVDTPPIAILPDANLLASMIDTTLLVVSAQSTPYPMVQRAAQAIGSNRILGVVLNRAEKSGMPANYGYGTNHYKQGHPTPARGRWFGWLRKRGSTPHVQ